MISFNSTDLFTLGILWLVLIFVVAIWLDKMIKIIIWNYLIIAINIWINLGIQILIFSIDNNIIKISNPDQIMNLLLNYNSVINLIIYFSLLTRIFFNTKLGINVQSNKFLKALLAIILAPFTTISIFTSLTIAILGTQILQPTNLINFAKQFEHNIVVYKIILLFPLWLVLPWFITILISSNFNIPKINFNLLPKKKKENEQQWE